MKQRLGDINGAIEDYTKSIELDPNDGLTYHNRGYCKQLLKDFDSACNDAKKSKQLGYDAEELINDVCD